MWDFGKRARWPFVHGLGAHLSVVVWSRRLWIEYLPQDLALLNPYLDIAGGRPHVNRPVPQPPYIQYSTIPNVQIKNENFIQFLIKKLPISGCLEHLVVADSQC